MADWSIKIVNAKDGAAFQPDLKGYDPGDPLPAQQDDLVTWNNRTKEAHWPWQTDSAYCPLSEEWVKGHSTLYLSDAIPAGRSSRPSYNAAQPEGKPPSWTIYYYCKLHPDRESERGTMQVKVVPQS